MGILQDCVMGFDASANVLDYFTFISATGAASSPTIGAGGRLSSSALIHILPTPSGTTSGSRARKTLPTPLSTIFLTFPLTASALPTSNSFDNSVIILELCDTGTTQIDVRLFGDGRLRVTRAGTVLATSNYVYQVNTFPFLELKAVIHGSAGVIDILAEGSSVFSGGEITGINTKNTANAYATEFVLACVLVSPTGSGLLQPMTIKFDDVIARDDHYSGFCHVREDRATGMGSVDDGVPGGSSTQPDTRRSVDESTPNGDVDHASLVNVGDKFRLTYPPIPGDSEVVALIPKFYASKDASGPAGFKANLLIGASEYTPGAGS
jgi:hypothetical protein